MSLESERQASNSQSWNARICCSLSPRDGIFHQTLSRLPAANLTFLGPWVVGICQPCHSLRSAPQRRHMHTWDSALPAHPGNRAAGTGQVSKMHGPPGTVRLPSTRSPELLGLRRAQNEWLRLGKCLKRRAHLGQCHHRAPWRLSCVDSGSTRHLRLWHCGPSAVSTPHTRQRYLFVVSPPPQQHN